MSDLGNIKYKLILLRTDLQIMLENINELERDLLKGLTPEKAMLRLDTLKSIIHNKTMIK